MPHRPSCRSLSSGWQVLPHGPPCGRGTGRSIQRALEFQLAAAELGDPGREEAGDVARCSGVQKPCAISIRRGWLNPGRRSNITLAFSLNQAQAALRVAGPSNWLPMIESDSWKRRRLSSARARISAASARSCVWPSAKAAWARS
nr:hypothetical protein [Hankyongella ginsenosidimutans]